MNDADPIKGKKHCKQPGGIRKLMARDKLDHWVIGSAGQAVVSKMAAYSVTDSRY